MLFMKKKELAILMGLLLSLILTSFAGFAKECDVIRDDTFRLHILANSDSQEDQAVKLKVRDRILQEFSFLFADAQDKNQAMQNVQAHLEEIVSCARQVLKENGKEPVASAQVVNMYFTTREYEDFTMPAGMYDALRITLGEGKGHNWWCVMFPPMCIPAAAQQQTLQENYTEQEQQIITSPPEYEARFFLVELFEGVKAWLS